MSNSEPGRDDPRTARRLAVIAMLAVATALMLVIGVVVTTALEQHTATTPLPPATTPTVTAGTPSIRPTTVPGRPTTSPAQPGRIFRYQALWPFGSEQDAAVWQHAYRTGGSQPWHLDAAKTALSFTTGFLGFDEVNKVVRRTVRGDDATIAVGYSTGTTTLSVAAVVHLRRIGQGGDAPWEVVGTRDTSLTLDRPRYGATVSSPVIVGGRITGVDEAIRVEVRQPSANGVLGSYCCLPVGGQGSRWSASVFFRDPTDDVLVIVASTGGHYQAVEQFAVTAVQPWSKGGF